MHDKSNANMEVSFAGDMPVQEFKRAGEDFLDWIADYFTDIDNIPVLPDIQPGAIKKMLPRHPPQKGESIDDILKDLNQFIHPGMTHWNHPGFFAYFAITGSGPGILGEMVSAAYNINGMLWKSGPAPTELEQTTLGWLRLMLGLPEAFWGIIYDTASISTMHAIAAAREQCSDLEIREKGMTGRELPRLTLYCSEQAHSSIDKSALTLGLGLEGIRKIPVDENFCMIPEKLEQAISTDLSSGMRPFCVVAAIGTTSTTSVDPVNDIADICKRHNLWLHIDAAYAGSTAICPEMRFHFKGWERADSIVVNPHKWLFVPVDLSAFYTRKPEILKRAFSLETEYLKTGADSKVENYMDYGLQLGRRFRSLKLWFVLRYFGVEGLQQRIRYHLSLARKLSGWIDAHCDFERLAPTGFSTVCFRANPKKRAENDLNRLNEKLLEHINHSGKIFLSHTKLNEKFTIRFAIGNLRTEERHVREAWNIIQENLAKIHL